MNAGDDGFIEMTDTMHGAMNLGGDVDKLQSAVR